MDRDIEIYWKLKGEITNMKMETKLVVAILLLVAIIQTSSATTVELVKPEKLPPQLNEGEQMDYTIKISGYDNVKSITIETSLISSDNKPIYDFGDLNPKISDNRYEYTITIDASDIPKTIQVTISGKVPVGEIVNNYGDITVTKFRDPKLKYYDIHADEKMVVVESFELVIEKKKTFGNAMEKITRPELSGVKSEIGKLFNRGLTNEAQSIAIEVGNIQWPNSLSLFGIIKVSSNLWISIIAVAMVIIGLVVGYLLGSRSASDD